MPLPNVTVRVSRPTVTLMLGRVPTASGDASLGADLTAIEALTGTGLARRTGDGAWDVQTVTAAGLALLDDADAATQRGTLGLGSMATQAAGAVAITGGSVTGITDLAVADGGTGASDAATARTNLGLGSMATQAAGAVAITGGSIAGITDLAVADGGTGASDAATARTNLGLGSMATQAAGAVAITGGSVAGITDLAVADGGTGASDAATARTNLGLGSMATQAAGAVAITGGSVAGITDLAIADGGTGASTASAARAALSIPEPIVGPTGGDWTNSTTTDSDLTGLTFTPVAGAVYLVEWWVSWYSAATATGFTGTLNVGNAVQSGSFTRVRGAASNAAVAYEGPGSSASVGGTSGPASSAYALWYGAATIVAHASAPTPVQLRGSSEVGGSPVTAPQGHSLLRYTRLS